MLAQESKPTEHEAAKLVVNVEDFCSPTKLRTSNARIHWRVPAEALVSARIASLATARQSLQATVYSQGFEKGLFVSLPLTEATPDRPLAARAPHGHPHNDECLWRCGDEPRVRGTQQDRGFGSTTRLMDRVADHSSAKWLKIWRREWDSNPAYNVGSTT